MALSLILAIGIVCFLILKIAFNLDEQHFLLKLLLIMITLSIMILIPKVAVDTNDHCDFVLSNTTVSGNLTSYQYDHLCVENVKRTDTIFYKSYLFFLLIFVLYVLVYFHKEAIEFLGSLLRK